jgi:hypothetical protein
VNYEKNYMEYLVLKCFSFVHMTSYVINFYANLKLHGIRNSSLDDVTPT